MSDTRRAVSMTRVAPTKFTVTNVRGGQITTGSGEDPDFTPGELLLAAIGACTGVDTDILTSRRAEPVSFRVGVSGDKVTDDQGSHLVNLAVTFDVQFPDGPEGDAARDMLPKIVARSREKLCTVGRTVQIGTPIRDEFGPVSASPKP
ncbi:OsmC family protein [Cumulibacter soli]|uniref:OsmC family protein n=1 Tax=Cumulibacter soli TaxID=2546344 RepID=UPI001ABA938E|nr:OsmC family protein [Cumulibacter soli]